MASRQKRSKPTASEVTIRLSRHPDIGYSWYVIDGSNTSDYGGAGGFESVQEMFSDLSFVGLLQGTLGKDSVPAEVVAYSRMRDSNRLPIPDDLVNALKERFGVPVSDKRKK